MKIDGSETEQTRKKLRSKRNFFMIYIRKLQFDDQHNH